MLVAGPAISDPPVDLVLGGDVRIDGAMGGDRSGTAVSPAGDVNGDGFGDLIIGAYFADNNGRSDSGSTYIVFGGATWANRDLAAPSTGGFRIDGAAANDHSGAAVAGIGDINADGYDDVLIGAPGADNNGRNGSGSTYIVFGGPSATNRDLAALGAGGVRIDGATAGDTSGNSVAGPGDVNGDGRPDLLIGGTGADNNGRTLSGSTYVVYGRTSAVNLDLASLGSSGFRIDGAATGDRSGWCIAGIGDVNADGYDDVLIGAPFANNNGRSYSGSSYVVYGSATPTDRDLVALGAAGFRIDGAGASDESGEQVAGPGDVNADGRPDLLIGAVGADNNGRTNSGSTYVVYGSNSPTNLDLASLGSGGFRIDGAASSDRSGWGIAGIGDVNADGYDDVLIGAPFADNNGRSNSGSSYVVYGSSSASNRDLTGLGSGGFRIDGATASDLTGYAVAGLRDVNGDRGDDMLIAAPYASNSGRDEAGSSYLLFGTPKPTPTATLTVTARKARKAVPRTGRTRLVRDVVAGPGQTAAIRVKVKPKRAKSRMKFTKTATTLKVRTRHARRCEITVRVTASGTGFRPTTWKRTWKVR